jgi:hypothetical protein
MKKILRSLIISIALLALVNLPASAITPVTENLVTTRGWLFAGSAVLKVQTLDGVHWFGTIKTKDGTIFTLRQALVSGRTGQLFTGFLTSAKPIQVKVCSYCTTYPVPAGTHFPFTAWLGTAEFRGKITIVGFVHPFCGGVDVVPNTDKRCLPLVASP